MNRIHRLVVNRCTGFCQAVSEVAKGSCGAADTSASVEFSPRFHRIAAACLLAVGALGATGSFAQVISAPVTGTTGSTGSTNLGNGGPGREGGAAAQTAIDTALRIESTVTGGTGGLGGDGGTRTGGPGGLGGTAVLGNASGATIDNVGTVVGGKGGSGGSAAQKGRGGAGGVGVALTTSLALTNSGTIAGGEGGPAGLSGSNAAVVALGGAAVTATGGATIVNDGTLRGGLSGSGLTRGEAVLFTGGANRLELHANSVLIGNVTATVGGGDTLALGGKADGTFDSSLIGAKNQFRNFSGFEKTGTSTWTLFGATSAVTSWNVAQGALSIAADASLGAVSGGLTLNGGTLQTTADISTLRAITVGAGGATLETAGDTTYTVAGIVSGDGGLLKTGSGTTILSAANTYQGGTTIAAGTLVGATGSFGDGAIVNNAMLVLDQATDGTLRNTVSGTGGLAKTGAGTLVLAGTNSHTGGTTISAGTLQVGQGGLTGSIVGDVANQGILAFDRADAFTLDGAISGTGSVRQLGAGTTTLTGVNTYTGGTTIASGTLVGSSDSFGSGAIQNDASLVIAQGADGRLANPLSGSGQLLKLGAGRLEMTGDSAAFAGRTDIAAGALAVNGALGGILFVGSGGVLQGTGTVGTTVVASGGTLAPGNSIGTLNVAGNLTLAAGSTYQVEAAADGRADQVHTTGSATLQGGTLSVLATGTWRPTTSYTVLLSDGGVAGRFAGASTDMAFLEPFLTYGPQSVTLRLQRNDVTFADVAQTANQRAAAGGVAALRTGSLYSTVVQLNAPDARAAFDSLAGEVHASVKTAAVEDSRFVREAGVNRLRQASDLPVGERHGAWAKGFGSWGDSDGDGNASSTDRSTSGILFGADTQVAERWRVGLLGGYSRSRVSLDDRASSAGSDSYHAGVYGGTQWGALGLRVGAAYSVGDIDTQRSIAFTGFADATRAGYDVKTAQVFGELGWKMPTASGALEPFIGLALVNLRTEGFAETGGAAALNAGKSTDRTSFSTLGIRGTTAMDAGLKTALSGLLGWRHAFGDTDLGRTVGLAGQPGFEVAGVPVAKDALVMEGGIDLTLRRDLTVGLAYVGQVGSQIVDHGVRAKLLWKF